MMNPIRTVVGLLLAACLQSLQSAEAPSTALDGQPLPYCIVVTGGELLEGVYADAYTPYLTRLLRPLGGQCVASLTVDDNREDIHRALRFATNRAPLVIVTGGLGPTPNDITRETLADFTGIALREHPDVIAELERRFKEPRDRLRPNVRRQALVPGRGRYLTNATGTAVGLVFDSRPAVIVALPGPPRELQPMAKGELIPFLRDRFGVRHFGTSVTLRFVGAGQSLIDQTIKDHIPVAPDVVITSLFDGSRVDFTFSLPGKSDADQARLRTLESQIREHLAEYIYAADLSTLEDVIVRKLKAQAGTLTLVEVGSHGALAAVLSTGQESAAVLRGTYAGPTEAAVATMLGLSPDQLHGSPVEQVQFLAAAAARRTGSNWAVGVSHLEGDDAAAPVVWVACQNPAGAWQHERIVLRNLGEVSRTTLTTQILDFLRRRCL
ncbi:MAG: molybdopterin-binding protein [Verrucomicrobiota bacterium]